MRTNNDDFYINSKKESETLRTMTEQLLKAWETGETEILDTLILPDAYIDFSMFDAGISREDLKRQLAYRPKPVDFSRIDPFNYVCLFEKGKAQISVETVGEFASDTEGDYQRLGFSGLLIASAVKKENTWFFCTLRYDLQTDDWIEWPRLLSSGIAQEAGEGDRAFISHWMRHDDRVGWFNDTRLPSIVAEYDAPWYVIKNPEYKGSDEEQIEEAMYRYFFGIDQNVFDLYRDAFSDDALIMYDEDRRFTKRGVIEDLKYERQGSPRCVHTGKFTSIQVNGNHAKATLYVRGPKFPQEFGRSAETQRQRLGWARYRLKFVREDGKWKISRLVYYPGWFVAEP